MANETPDFGGEFGRWLLGNPKAEAVELSRERVIVIYELMKMAPALMEAWVRETPEGKRWLAEQAGAVGVPLQYALPFDGGKAH